MNEIEKIQRKRFDFLNEVYKDTGGDLINFANCSEISKRLNLDSREALGISWYLQKKNLVKLQGADEITITEYGIDEIESAFRKPESATLYFPANIINIGQMIDSSFQQAAPGSTQISIINKQNTDEMQKMLQLLKDELANFSLKEHQLQELNAEIQTIEAQLKSPKPKSLIISSSFQTIMEILKAIAVTGAAAKVVTDIISSIQTLGI